MKFFVSVMDTEEPSIRIQIVSVKYIQIPANILPPVQNVMLA